VTVARTYRTLSLSLPPGVFEDLAAIGRKTGRTGARVATEVVLRAIADAAVDPSIPSPGLRRRRTSWCCQARVVPFRGQLVLPQINDGGGRWVPAIALLCDACGRQMHGSEYEGWIADA
jgi:hypothetical protein